MARIIRKIAFFGSASIEEDDPVWQDAFNTAKYLVKNGFEIVDGGGPGIMSAATQGAKAVGGKVTGITLYPEDMKNFEGRDKWNLLDREIRAKNYLKRTFGLLEHGDCFVIFKGGTGTISEFGMSWALAKLYFGHHKPIFLFGEYWGKIVKVFRKYMEIDKEEIDSLFIVNSPESVLYGIQKWEKKMQKLDHGEHTEGKYSL